MSATPAIPTPFSLPEAAISRILSDLGRPDYTFRDIAEMHGTNADALTIWLTRPDIEARLAAIESAIARRTRLIATNYLPSAVKTVTRILDEYNDEESHRPIDPRIPQHGELRRRSRETARRAASLLLRLAKFHQSPPRKRRVNEPDAQARELFARAPRACHGHAQASEQSHGASGGDVVPLTARPSSATPPPASYPAFELSPPAPSGGNDSTAPLSHHHSGP